jgi:hypothetical protein
MSYCWNFGDSNITATSNPVITHTYSAGGTYNVTLTVTDTLGLAASASQTLTVCNHDCAVTNISADPGWIYEGQTAHVNVTVSNLGDFPENVWVTLYYNMTADKSVDAYPVHLDAQQNFTLEFAWNTADTPCLNYTLTAVAAISAGSNALSGGTINVRLVGDVNGDGRVDLKDMALVARAFGSTPTSPNWNPAADLNGDGAVNMKDIALVARNFGQHI